MENLVVPRMKPAASETWEIRETLLAAEQETQRIPLEFPWPALIVGAHVSVTLAEDPTGLLVPTADDLLCLVDKNHQHRYTNSQGLTTAAGIGSTYVSLEALDTRHRDLHIHLDDARPVIGIQFRWKTFNAALWADAHCSIAFFVRPK